jgi:hypothetical protein
MTGRRPPELDEAPEFPEALYDEWHWFLSLNAARPAGLGASPLTESDIGWFFRNRRLAPEGWQIELIRRLDVIALQSVAKDSHDS